MFRVMRAEERASERESGLLRGTVGASTAALPCLAVFRSKQRCTLGTSGSRSQPSDALGRLSLLLLLLFSPREKAR